MEIPMSSLRPPLRLALIASLLTITATAYPQSSASVAESASAEHVENGVPLTQLIATVAKKTGKKFIVDPRVRGIVTLALQETTNLTYSDLLMILEIYDYTAAEYGGYVKVVPIAAARQLPSPILSGKESHPEAEVVSAVITLKNVPAAQVVPIMRPLIPQYGHLAALPCTNKLILVDTFGNVKRLEAIIQALDVGDPFKPEKCEGRPSGETGRPAQAERGPTSSGS
jgi:general secretion pathway protein D